MANHIYNSEHSNFEITSKRRKGFPSETQVKRGVRNGARKQRAVRKARAQRSLPVRFWTQLLGTAVSAPDDSMAQGGITFFRE